MAWTSLPRNVVRAALLDVDFYNQAEVDRSLDGQAAAVVILASILAGFGSGTVLSANIAIAMGVGALTGVVGWLVWSFVAMVVGTKVFGGTSDFGQMRRVVGFAYGPLAIGIVPWLGFIGAVWVLVASVIAIREGMEFSTQRSIATMVVGWGGWLLVTVVVNAVLGWEMRGAWPF